MELFIEAELQEALWTIKTQKAHGPDVIQVEKIVARAPTIWKQAEIPTIQKGEDRDLSSGSPIVLPVYADTYKKSYFVDD